MSVLDRAKLLAEIAKLGSEAYRLVVDKESDKDRKIAALEAQIAELKRKAGQ